MSRLGPAEPYQHHGKTVCQVLDIGGRGNAFASFIFRYRSLGELNPLYSISMRRSYCGRYG